MSASVTIERILNYFPPIHLPVLISEERLDTLSTDGNPLPAVFIDEVMLLWEQDIDEATEFIPCFSLPPQDNYYAIVYWKGSFLRYDFILITLDKDAKVINKKSIASTIIESSSVKKSIASIEEDLIINIIAGQSIDGEDYDPSMSRSFSMEILNSGEIIFLTEKEGI